MVKDEDRVRPIHRSRSWKENERIRVKERSLIGTRAIKIMSLPPLYLILQLAP